MDANARGVGEKYEYEGHLREKSHAARLSTDAQVVHAATGNSGGDEDEGFADSPTCEGVGERTPENNESRDERDVTPRHGRFANDTATMESLLTRYTRPRLERGDTGA